MHLNQTFFSAVKDKYMIQFRKPLFNYRLLLEKSCFKILQINLWEWLTYKGIFSTYTSRDVDGWDTVGWKFLSPVSRMKIHYIIVSPVWICCIHRFYEYLWIFMGLNIYRYILVLKLDWNNLFCIIRDV